MLAQASIHGRASTPAGRLAPPWTLAFASMTPWVVRTAWMVSTPGVVSTTVLHNGIRLPRSAVRP